MEGFQIEQKHLPFQELSANAESPCIYWLYGHFCGIIVSSKQGEVEQK